MKSKILQRTITIVLVFLVVMLTSLIEALPWWAFAVPLFLLGIFIGIKEWDVPVVSVGFFSGFVIWSCANVYFDTVASGHVLARVAALMQIPEIVVLLISGILGGSMAGLSLYTGKMMFSMRPSQGL